MSTSTRVWAIPTTSIVISRIAISKADGYFRGFDALRFPEAYASIEKADVERFLRENLTDSRRAISIIEPKKEG